MNPRAVWVGPVASFQVHAPASDLFIPCYGAEKTPICADLDLASVLASKGVPADQPIILHGHSAGGDAIKKYLHDPAARARTIAVVAHDATYQGFGDDEGYVAYGTEAAQNLPGRLFVATASGGSSSNARGGISDSASMAALRQRIEANTGQNFQAITSPWRWLPKQPVGAWQLGQVVFLDFGTLYIHADHANVLAPLINDNLVTPMLASPPGLPSVPTSSAPPVATAPAPPTYAPSTAPPSGWPSLPPSLSSLSSKPILPAALVAVGAGVFIYAMVSAFKKPRR